MLRSWGSSDQVALSLHALDNGNFLWDNIELSPEELAEILAKKLDPNKKEIVLLSCNDLASAQALAQATGKKVYTTDGAITIFENGIKRADNTKWYEVSSDGTAIELSSPPIKECSTCTGEGVQMGVAGAGSLVKDIISKRVVKTISKYDKNLGKMVDYPMYNNVALGKSSGGSLKQFGDEVGANVWTKETDNVFTSMYNLPERDYLGGFERSIGEVLDATTGANQGKILFDVTGVNV
ncbi:hypothetical protein [Flavobacterium columnare]|nr:hypothetical protein [Flavobacterium columnare]